MLVVEGKKPKSKQVCMKAVHKPYKNANVFSRTSVSVGMEIEAKRLHRGEEKFNDYTSFPMVEGL